MLSDELHHLEKIEKHVENPGVFAADGVKRTSIDVPDKQKPVRNDREKDESWTPMEIDLTL